MRQVLRRFHEGNGRGPNTQELLDLRAAVAAKMGVQVPEILDTDWDQKAIKKRRERIEDSENAPKSPYKSILTRKRTASEDDEGDEQPVAKKVKFGSKESEEEVSDEEKQKDEVEEVEATEAIENNNDEVGSVDENRDSSLLS
jgi:Mg-chelatase subunit ChlI